MRLYDIEDSDEGLEFESLPLDRASNDLNFPTRGVARPIEPG